MVTPLPGVFVGAGVGEGGGLVAVGVAEGVDVAVGEGGGSPLPRYISTSRSQFRSEPLLQALLSNLK